MKKYLKIIVIIFTICIVNISCIYHVRADSGWDTSYDGDFGGSDSWGGTDS